MPSIDAPAAWEMIREARRHVPTADWRPMAGVVISPGGRWSASCAISAAAAVLLDTLLPVAYGPSHYVIAQIGQSLDGRIATATGHSRYITDRASRVHLHRLRALVDAVVVGVGTVQTDDPQLTVRHVDGDHPARIVLDPQGRARHDRKLFTDGGPATWHAVCRGARTAPGARPLYLADGDATSIARQLLDRLAVHGLGRVLVEGGAATISRFIEAGCVDRLHVVVAPILIGSGREALELPEIDTLDRALRPVCHTYSLGRDALYDLDLHARG